MDLEALKFPIGKYNPPSEIDQSKINEWIKVIEDFPSNVKAICSNLSTEEKNWIYRPGGWSIKQVVHHCADSHLNSICRFKLALTEDNPTIKPYTEHLWAELVDGTDDDLTDSLLLLTGLHAKLGKLLRSLSPEDLQRTYIHPEHGKQFNLAYTIGNYSWHSAHHFAHIQQALQFKGKFD